MKLLLAALLLVPSLAFSFECPAPGETKADCPWAGVSRLIGEKTSQAEIRRDFSEYVPGLLKQLEFIRAHRFILKLWGQSINFDEFAKGEIVRPPLLSFLARTAGAEQPKGRIMPAGLEHTYGYLFSLLHTSFGFKRARWVDPEIELGFGLPAGSLGPTPSSGTLLSNVTCFAGSIALKDDPAAYALLKKVGPYCDPALEKYISSDVAHVRLSETAELPGGRAVTLRTDLVPFGKVTAGDSYLLVYSVHDTKPARTYLVTAFPVASSFVKMVTDPAGLGPGKPMQTRYNGYVKGLTEAGVVRGTRKVENLER